MLKLFALLATLLFAAGVAYSAAVITQEFVARQQAAAQIMKEIN